ncbi:flagellar biosynthetic protein FliR [Oceanobacillus oncorhynchi]|uniref:flagellar biosynthetic protein FliR n=1 Tax=Oceanobacillus oncorhynchi TaxID=545501 RepID=UPI00211711CA|nr:flagellar biosynthetic protein FliR [Oceanobacillus oncorhynchi]UUI38594.1 flagellar biosynthetic protein FliR [Oceanobacillus oncorhynchi]
MIEMINWNLVPAFMLIFVRIMAFFVIMPLFSYRSVPVQFKIGISFFLTLILISTVDISNVALNDLYLFLLFKEALIGICIGLIAFILVSAIQVAGGFVDFQMGFAIANVIDPQTGAQSPLTGQYFYIIALLFLLSVDGHHMILNGMMNSFTYIPLDQFIPFGEESIVELVLTTFNTMFLIAFQIAVPIVGCLFLVDVALGIVARTVPQMNVFVVGLPLKILVSFVAILVFLALYIGLLQSVFEAMFRVMEQLMALFGGV